MIEEIKIPISKTKLTALLIAALLFVVAGIWLSINPERFDSVRQLNVTNIMIVGIIGVVFFSACAIFILKKLFGNSFGLMINNEGITDHSTGVSLGLIKWADIVDIRMLHVQRRHKFILVEVRNPEAYISTAKSRITKMALKANYRLYGSPININPGSLQSSYSDLIDIIETAYQKQLGENSQTTSS